MESINDYIPQSPDHNAERLQKLKELFPDLFTVEGKIDEKELQKLANPDNIHETERYEFRWFGKSQAKRNAFTPTNATFIFDENRSVNPENTENIIIEGDNLDSLKLLSNAYREKIKCIYIDPPYNTGKDFVYSDNFTQEKKAYWEDAGIVENGVKIDTNTETDGRFHSNWLNMMYSRLLIARQLLREDGVIFISIDDNEVHHLRKLCDEVFGEENFLGMFPRITKKAGKTTDLIAKNNDYILSYKKELTVSFLGDFVEDEQYKLSDEFEIYRGKYKLSQTLDYGSIQYSPSLDYEINLNDKIFRAGNVSKNEMEERKLRNPSTDFCWRWSKDLFKFGYENGFIELKGNRIYTKTYQNAIIRKDNNGYYIDQIERTKSISSIDFINNKFSNDNSKKDLDNVFGYKIFDYTKPVSLLNKIIKISTNKNDLILDFFAGSGTTGQAVMELNKEDGGNRKFILVQLPEQTDENSEAHKNGYKKISDITIERNKRVIEKIVNEEKEKHPDLFTEENQTNIEEGLGFKVFKLSKSNFPRVEFAPNPEKTDEENVEDLKKYISEKESQLVNAFNREELLTEILVKRGFNLNYKTIPQPKFTKNDILLATDGNKEAFITLDIVIAEETVNYFKENTIQKFICLERALDTTKKFNLKHYLGEMFDAF